MEGETSRGRMRMAVKGMTTDWAALLRLARDGGMIQITPQMRILVAVDPVDDRKHAPSIDMRSCAVPTHKIGHARGLGRCITRYGLGRGIASNLSGGRKRPRRKVGGTKEAMASSFSVESALRQSLPDKDSTGPGFMSWGNDRSSEMFMWSLLAAVLAAIRKTTLCGGHRGGSMLTRFSSWRPAWSS
jgi:hypothetical protein